MKNTEGEKYCHIDNNLNTESEVHGSFKEKSKPRVWVICEMVPSERKAILEMMRCREQYAFLWEYPIFGVRGLAEVSCY